MDQKNSRGKGIIIKGEHCKMRPLACRDANGDLIHFYGMTAIPLFGTLRYEKVGCGSQDLVKVVDCEIDDLDGKVKTIPVSCISSKCEMLKSYLASPPDSDQTEWPEDFIPPQAFFEEWTLLSPATTTT